MNVARLLLAALAGFAAYMICGGVAFALFPSLKAEFLKYPAVYRDQAGQMSHLPLGMAGMFFSVLVVAVLYALSSRAGSGGLEGVRFGAWIGLFAVGSFVLHNYVNLNIGLKLTLQQAGIYFAEWVLVGLVVGLVYRPAAGR